MVFPCGRCGQPVLFPMFANALVRCRCGEAYASQLAQPRHGERPDEARQLEVEATDHGEHDAQNEYDDSNDSA